MLITHINYLAGTMYLNEILNNLRFITSTQISVNGKGNYFKRNSAGSVRFN